MHDAIVVATTTKALHNVILGPLDDAAKFSPVLALADHPDVPVISTYLARMQAHAWQVLVGGFVFFGCSVAIEIIYGCLRQL